MSLRPSQQLSNQFYKVNKNRDRRGYAATQKSTRDSIGRYWPNFAMLDLHDVNWQKIFGSKFVQAQGEDKSVAMATGYVTHLLNHCSPVLFSQSPAGHWILGSSRAFTNGCEGDKMSRWYHDDDDDDDDEDDEMPCILLCENRSLGACILGFQSRNYTLCKIANKIPLNISHSSHLKYVCHRQDRWPPNKT